MPWEPSSITVEDWGRLQIVVNDVDVTFFRDVPTQVKTWDFTEPFADATAQIYFPQITVLEPWPAWMTDWANIEINRVHPDNSVSNIWEGLVASFEQENVGIGVDCLGALYQADLFKKPPSFDLDAKDIGKWLPDMINEKITKYGLRCQYMAKQETGVYALDGGSWQPMLTGFIQDLLATAVTNSSLGRGIGVGLVPHADGGYWVIGSEGAVIPFGPDTPFKGSMTGRFLNRPISGSTVTADSEGYWLVGEDGGVFTFGTAVFYGSLGDAGLDYGVVDIEATPTALGYWLLGDDGGIFAFGNATYSGNAQAEVVSNASLAVSMAHAGSASAYWILLKNGVVVNKGGATHYGNASNPAKTWVAIGAKGSTGYYLIASDGDVEAKGSAITYPGDEGFHNLLWKPLNQPMHDIFVTTAGYVLVAEDGGVFAFGDAPFHGSVPGNDATIYYWTLMKDYPRTPVLQQKQFESADWTLTVGTPGLTPNLSRDLTMAPNVIYGEGVDHLIQCHWRNTKYPDASSIDSAFFLPLAALNEVSPTLYKTTGEEIGANPDWDPNRVRIEHFENMGDQVTKREGVQSAQGEIHRYQDPGWYGTLTLNIDPEEGSRYNIRAGQDVYLKNFKGTNIHLHIAKASVNWESQSVSLDVDQKHRDCPTLQSVRSRDRELNDPTRRPKPIRRVSRQVEDRVAIFDCEAGAGKMDSTTCSVGWSVHRLPFAERGNIVKTLIECDNAIEFSAALFAKEWSVQSLRAKMPDGPFTYDAEGEDPWNGFSTPTLSSPTLPDDGLMIAWGGPDQLAGYSPELETDEGIPTGKLIDDAQWYYECKFPPWLWLAIYHEEAVAQTFRAYFTPGALAPV